MSSRVLLLLAFLLSQTPAAAAQPVASEISVTPAELRRHIDFLASDAFGGRQPGTPGETLTTGYLVRELGARGVEPAGEDGTWYQRVPLAERGVGRHQARWTAGRRRVTIPEDALILISRDDEARIANAPVVFAGHGAVMPERGIDQLAGADLRGAVALIMFEGPAVEGFPSYVERLQTVAEAGAAAVIAIVGPDLPWNAVRAAAARPTTMLDSGALPPVFGTMSWSGAGALVRAAGRDLATLLDEQPGSSFRSVTLPIRATMEAAAPVRRYTSNNVVGRIRGSGSSGQSVVLLGHWDHIGLCRPEGAEDRICNGAVDNASGLATLIEAAGRLAAGPRPQRDILILATTAEEIGLLGAEQFARTPPAAAGSIVAAVNVDTVAVHPAGTPVAVMGGTPAMQGLVGRVAVQLGRRLDDDREADALIQRQDGWAFVRNGIPAMMAGGSFSDMRLLGRFLGGNYHGPGDEPSPGLELGGAAEDTNLLVALARALADPAGFPAAAR